jgi:hypothetical protein
MISPWLVSSLNSPTHPPTHPANSISHATSCTTTQGTRARAGMDSSGARVKLRAFTHPVKTTKDTTRNHNNTPIATTTTTKTTINPHQNLVQHQQRHLAQLTWVAQCLKFLHQREQLLARNKTERKSRGLLRFPSCFRRGAQILILNQAESRGSTSVVRR